MFSNHYTKEQPLIDTRAATGPIGLVASTVIAPKPNPALGRDREAEKVGCQKKIVKIFLFVPLSHPFGRRKKKIKATNR